MSLGEVFLKIVNLSITAGWLVLAVIALRLILRRAPRRLVCLMWALVAVRLICPVTIESRVSLVPSRETLPVEQIYSEKREIANDPANWQISTGILAVDGTGSGTVLRDVSGGAALRDNISVFGIIWLSGVIALAVYGAVTFILLKRRVSTAVLTEPGVKRSEFIDTPFVLGLVKPVIYLPYSVSEDDTECVLAHERAHMARLDHWWKPLGYLILSAYWFNPLVWLAYILFCRDMEAACDERVCRNLDEDERRAYATALLDCSVRRRAVTVCPLAFGEVGVKNRIKSVMNYKKPAFWLIILAVIAIIAAAVFFLTDPVRSGEPESPFGRTWLVESVVYESPNMDHTYIAGEEPPRCVTDNGGLYTKNDGWSMDGRFEKTELSRSEFYCLFVGRKEDTFGWLNGENMLSDLMRDNYRIWRFDLISEQIFYLLLLQDNGDVYLGYGYFDTEGLTDPDSDDSFTRVLMKLTGTENQNFACWAGDGFALVLDGREYTYVLKTVDREPERGELLAEFTRETDDESAVWEVYALTDYPDFSQVLIVSGADSEWLGVPDEPSEPDYGRIAELVETLESTPANSTDALVHRDAHPEEYARLREMGQKTLEWCFRQFLQGGESETRGNIMWSLCADIIEDMGEWLPEVDWVDPDSVTGRDWFEIYAGMACRWLDEYGDGEIDKQYPGCRVLIETIGGRDSLTGEVIFYNEPTPEFTDPSGVTRVELTHGEYWELRLIVEDLTDVSDDNAVNREPFTFDGEIHLAGVEYAYYFSYEKKIVYYGHWYGDISDYRMEYIKDIDG